MEQLSTALEEIMKRLKSNTGMEEPKKMTDEEYINFKCDAYNQNKGNLNDSDGYNCEKCNNKGFIAEPRFQNDSWYEVHCECQCQRVRKTLIRLARSGLKDIIKKYSFNDYETEEPWQATLKDRALRYAKDPKGWFFIGGQTGAGKTHLCTAICGAMLKSDKRVKYMLWRDDITKIKSSVTDAKTYESLITEYKNEEVLYIDDLFKNGKGNDGKVQPPTGADIQVAFEILNYRYNNPKLITIISSERDLYALADIDEAVAGRISEMSFKNGYGFNIKSDMKKNYRLKGLVDL